jgi:hypothetical protein
LTWRSAWHDGCLVFGMDKYIQFQEQLRQLGLQLESIAHEMQTEGFDQEGTELEQLGVKIEHFGDHLELASIVAKSQSTVPPAQMSG